MTLRCDWGVTPPAFFNGNGNTEAQSLGKTSVRDKFGIASLIGKSESYSIKNSPRIRLNGHHEAEEQSQPVPDRTKGIERVNSTNNIVHSASPPAQLLQRRTVVQLPKVVSIQSPRYTRQVVIPSSPVYLKVDANQKRPQEIQNQLKLANVCELTSFSNQKVPSTGCDSPSQSTSPYAPISHPRHRRTQTSKPTPVPKEMSQWSSPIGTPRQHKLAYGLRNYNQDPENDQASLIELFEPEDFVVLGKLYPKFTVSTHGDSLRESMHSQFSEVLERTAFVKSSQMMKKYSERQ